MYCIIILVIFYCIYFNPYIFYIYNPFILYLYIFSYFYNLLLIINIYLIHNANCPSGINDIEFIYNVYNNSGNINNNTKYMSDDFMNIMPKVNCNYLIVNIIVNIDSIDIENIIVNIDSIDIESNQGISIIHSIT